MITRIVKMVFTENGKDEFLENFEKIKHKIRAFEGCGYLELWQDKSHANTFFTYSKWQSEDFLNAYRKSDLFVETWAFTKARFADKPQAWTIDVLEKLV